MSPSGSDGSVSVSAIAIGDAIITATIEGKSGVRKLDAFDKDHAVVLLDNKGRWDLETIELP